MNRSQQLSARGEEDSEVSRALVRIVVIIALPLFLIWMLIYKIAFAWWLDSIRAKRWQEKFTKRIRDRLSFLFEQYGGEFVPNEFTRTVPGMYFALATIKVNNILLRILENKGCLTVHVAPDFASSSWSELEAVLCATGAGDRKQRTSYVGFYDLDLLLRDNLNLVEYAFQKDNYDHYKKLIDNIVIPKKRFQKSYVDWLFGRSQTT